MTASVSLAERGTLPTITSLHEALREAFAQEGDVVLDASALVDGDVSLVQVLLTARAEAERQGRALRLSAPAQPALSELFARAGFAPASPHHPNAWYDGETPA
jgi:anti-anti-sigma regulatory factor